MQIPGIIFFINADIGSIAQNTLTSQLMINEVISDKEFDARVVADPNYPEVVHLNNLRILVLRQTFQDFTNRNLADIVLFVKQGMATVLKNNLGPPTLSLPTQRLNIYALLHRNDNFFPFPFPFPFQSKDNVEDRREANEYLRGAPDQLKQLLIDPFDPSGAHDANPDNEYNNPDFINRK